MRRVGQDDGTARATLIERNLRLVVYIARKFENTGISIEDLISIGAIGLIKAVNSFNPDKNIKLATYASRCIENEILMVLRKTNRLKLEVSFDEPLNTDWDGNELLLSDILGTDADLVYTYIYWTPAPRSRCFTRRFTPSPRASGTSSTCATVWATKRSTRRRKSPT